MLCTRDALTDWNVRQMRQYVVHELLSRLAYHSCSVLKQKHWLKIDEYVEYKLLSCIRRDVLSQHICTLCNLISTRVPRSAVLRHLASPSLQHLPLPL